jgi:hypothetical protein
MYAAVGWQDTMGEVNRSALGIAARGIQRFRSPVIGRLRTLGDQLMPQRLRHGIAAICGTSGGWQAGVDTILILSRRDAPGSSSRLCHNVLPHLVKLSASLSGSSIGYQSKDELGATTDCRGAPRKWFLAP